MSFCPFSLCQLCCLSYFDLRILITPLLSSNFIKSSDYCHGNNHADMRINITIDKKQRNKLHYICVHKISLISLPFIKVPIRSRESVCWCTSLLEVSICHPFSDLTIVFWNCCDNILLHDVKLSSKNKRFN